AGCFSLCFSARFFPPWPAGRLAAAARVPRHLHNSGDRRPPAVNVRGRAVLFLSGGRADRARPPVANRQAEAQGVAVSLLMVHTLLTIPARSRPARDSSSPAPGRR